MITQIILIIIKIKNDIIIIIKINNNTKTYI